MARHYEIVNAALVALVAIVGMIFFFNSGGGAVGAFHEKQGIWQSGVDPKFYQLGVEEAGPSCLSKLTSADSSNEWSKCCVNECTPACRALGFDPNPRLYFFTQNPLETCGKACVAGCEYQYARTLSIGFDYRGQRTSP